MRPRALRSAVGSAAVLTALTACASEASGPSNGTYTIDFPSTAAAVATDFVQVLVFDVPEPAARPALCERLITSRITDPSTLRPATPPATASNICEMLAGRRAVTVPYGEHALLAIAQRRDASGGLADFMIGCAIMTIGEGDAPLPIPLRLVSVASPVPATTCASIADYCSETCD